MKRKLAEYRVTGKVVEEDGQPISSDDLRLDVPEAAAAQPGVTVRRLLTHSSGLLGD